MVHYEIEGGHRLEGECRIQGSKKAVLPMMAAALLQRGTVILHNCPRILDVFCMIRILEHLGCRVDWDGHTLLIDAYELRGCAVPREEAKKMRSSVILLGALLGRRRRAVLCCPGGCVIGERPIDLHLAALSSMGAEICQEEEDICVETGGLHGARICLRFPSVGATENILLGAVLADGETVIRNAAREPEIMELCRLLRQMGAKIAGDGTARICVQGVRKLHGTEITVMPDRIVAGTYLLAAAGCGGSLYLPEAPVRQLACLRQLYACWGMTWREKGGSLYVQSGGDYPAVRYVETRPYPGFPTDLQSPLAAVLLKAKGESCIRETIFESRFRAAEEFRKLGADVQIAGQLCRIRGREKLRGAVLDAYELRGGAALIVAGLMAEGASVVRDEGFLERGYEHIVEDLRGAGAALTCRRSLPTAAK